MAAHQRSSVLPCRTAECECDNAPTGYSLPSPESVKWFQRVNCAANREFDKIKAAFMFEEAKTCLRFRQHPLNFAAKKQDELLENFCPIAYRQPVIMRILLFAHLKSAVGHSEIQWPAAGSLTLEQFWHKLLHDYPQLAPYQKNVRLACNNEYVFPDAVLHDTDEIALIPPVSGG